MDTAGLSAYIERCIAYTNYVVEQSKLAMASLIEMRGATADMVDLAPRAKIYQYWRKHWPQGQYPSEQEWTLIRGELSTGSLVFIRVGDTEQSNIWLRLMSLTNEATPVNGTFIPQLERDEYATKLLCPLYGKTPANAIWECIIYSTRTGA